MTNTFNSIKSGLGSFFSGVGNVAGDVVSGIGGGVGNAVNGIGDLFSNGTQPMSGSPNATSSLLSQGATDIPDVGGGSGPMSPSSFSGPSSGGGMSTAAANLGDATSDFDWGSLVKQVIPTALTAYSVWQGTQEPSEIGDLRALAQDAATRSGTLNEGAIQAMQGRLPGGAQASIDQALEAARARIRSNYASLGMTGSTPEAQDLAYADMAASAQAFQIGQQMAATGFGAAAGGNTLAATLYQAILASETARGTALGDALAEFAAGMVDSDTTIGRTG